MAALVLANNDRQTLAISVSQTRGRLEFAPSVRLLQRLEAEGRLDRRLEALPDEATLARRVVAGTFFVRPEIAALPAYKQGKQDHNSWFHNRYCLRDQIYGFFCVLLRQPAKSFVTGSGVEGNTDQTSLHATEQFGLCQSL